MSHAESSCLTSPWYVIHDLVRTKNWPLLRKQFQMPHWKTHASEILSDQDLHGRTPLHVFYRLADVAGRLEEERLIPEKYKKRVYNEHDMDESLPLDIAKSLMHEDSILTKDNEGQNVMHILCNIGVESSVEELIRETLNFASFTKRGHGARHLLSDTDRLGETPFHLACQLIFTSFETVRTMLHYCPNASIFVDPSLQTNKGAAATESIYEEWGGKMISPTERAPDFLVPKDQASAHGAYKISAALPRDPGKPLSSFGSRFGTVSHSFKATEKDMRCDTHPLSLQCKHGYTCLHHACGERYDVNLLNALCQHWPEAALLEDERRKLPVGALLDFGMDEENMLYLGNQCRVGLSFLLDTYIKKFYGLWYFHQQQKHPVERNVEDDSSNAVDTEKLSDIKCCNGKSIFEDEEEDEHEWLLLLNRKEALIPKYLSPIWDCVCILLQAAYRQIYTSTHCKTGEESALNEVRPLHAAIAISEFPRDVFMIALVKCHPIREEARILDQTMRMMPLHIATSLRLPRNADTEYVFDPRTPYRRRRVRHDTTLFKIEALLFWYPEAARIYTPFDNTRCRGRHLPLMLAIMNNHPMEHLRALLNVAPETIRCRDINHGSDTYHFYPFMVAAVGSNSTLSVVYELLLHDPTVLFLPFRDETYKDKNLYDEKRPLVTIETSFSSKRAKFE